MDDQLRYEYTGQKRLFFILAVFWLTVGLSLISYAGYTYLEAGDGGEQLVYVRRLYATPTPVVAGAGQPGGSPLVGQDYRMVIEKLGVDGAVGVFGLDADGVPEVPYEADLIAWYNFSAVPGSGSNALFAGHVTWNGDAVFRHIHELVPGDSIILRGANGVQLEYRVSVNMVVEPNIEEVRQWMDPADKDVITLITCAGTFTWTGDPTFGGEYDKRQIVRADFVGVAPPGAAAVSGR
ncbi:MAG: class F sortase [Dehalococcoidia bacterium]|nr:class F sortase [Dehalococcoidia bacterium]